VIAWCALAQAAPSAHDHYARAVALYGSGRYADAAEAFLAAHRLKPTAVLLFNRAQALRKNGQFRDALESYQSFLRDADERAPLRSEAERWCAEIDAYLETEKTADAAQTKREQPIQLEAGPLPPVVVEPPPLPRADEPPPARRPLYKAWWLWTGVGVAVAGVAVGLGVGLTQSPSGPSSELGTRQAGFVP
jgi:tetratricopeptide (TPR) repeat protein